MNKQEQVYDILEQNLCKHILTQNNRKGMLCNEFLSQSIDQNYCSDHANKHVQQNETNNTMMQSFKVRIYPTTEQKKKLNNYFGCSRYTYNKCVEEKINDSFKNIRNKLITVKPMKTVNEKIIVFELVKDNKSQYFKCIKSSIALPNLTFDTLETTSFLEKNTFLKKCPKEIRAFAVKEYRTGLENANDEYKQETRKNNWKMKQNELHNKKYKIKEIKNPEMKFRTKKQQQSITINKNSVTITNDKKLIIYPEAFDKNPIKMRTMCTRKDKKLKKILEKTFVYHDIKIIKTTTNKYYVCLTSDEKIEHPEIDANKIVASDPGERTFQTTYNPYEVYEFGKNIKSEIKEMHDKIDENKKQLRILYAKLMNKIYNDRDEKEIIQDQINYRLMKHKKLNEKLRNMISDMHNKTITKLLEYDIIYMPKLNTKRIVEQKNYYGSKRTLNALRHGSFIKNLQNKAKLKGKILRICSEHLTTKICDKCFNRNEIGSNTIYECKAIGCNNKTGRDIRSGKMILLKQVLGQTPDNKLIMI
jgi:transposase